MARKHNLPPHDMISDGDMSGNLLSDPTNVSQIDQAIIFINWTGTPDGTFTIEGAQVKSTELRANSPLPTSVVWNTLDIDPMTTAGETNHQIVFTELPFTHLRLRYTASSGTGTGTATISGKSRGA